MLIFAYNWEKGVFQVVFQCMFYYDHGFIIILNGFIYSLPQNLCILFY